MWALPSASTSAYIHIAPGARAARKKRAGWTVNQSVICTITERIRANRHLGKYIQQYIQQALISCWPYSELDCLRAPVQGATDRLFPSGSFCILCTCILIDNQKSTLAPILVNTCAHFAEYGKRRATLTEDKYRPDRSSSCKPERTAWPLARWFQSTPEQGAERVLYDEAAVQYRHVCLGPRAVTYT